MSVPEDLQESLGSLSPEGRQEAYSIVRELVERDIAARLNGRSVQQIKEKNGAQSCAFLISMLPLIWERLAENRRYTTYSWLDVGPGAGFAACLLADLHSSMTLGYQLKVSVVDIIRQYHPLMELTSKSIEEKIVADIFGLDKAFDYLSCSHVIEHVPNPVEFVERLQRIARKRVFVLTPWKEREELLTKGHQNIFDETFLSALGNPGHQLLKSPAWGAFLDPPYEMLFLDLPGKAT